MSLLCTLVVTVYTLYFTMHDKGQSEESCGIKLKMVDKKWVQYDNINQLSNTI